MTITEHLEFSVITAPVASLDRRTLSQAWYSALYGAAARPCSPESRKHHSAAVGETIHEAVRHSESQDKTRMCAPARSRGRRANEICAQIERRTARSPLARKIERVFLDPKRTARQAAFTFEGDRGRVQILLHSQGANCMLIAICPSSMKAQVLQALAQVRYALALRGIDLHTQTREQLPC